ncbi:MAG: HAD-IB family hydrolase [Calditrichales bacterium]|nr:MAG: HAD-IB family hydrolase [Calditrichales bacterium]
MVRIILAEPERHRQGMRSYIAFFDLDQTLLDINSGKPIARAAFREGLLSRKDLSLGSFYFSLYKMGWLPSDLVIPRVLSWFKDMPEDPFGRICRDIFENLLRHHIRKGARECLRFHQSQDAHTVILSAAFEQVCLPIQEMLGIDHVISTRMEVVNGHFTGRTIGQYCYGREKLRIASQYCHTYGVPLESAYFYTDSYSDLPLLEKIGHPVCISPEKKLERIAVQKGWYIPSW